MALPSDDELFKQSVIQTPADPAAAATPPPEPQADGAPPPSDPPVAPQPTPEATEATIPSWRLREEADARRAAEDRARALESRLAEVSKHIQQNTKQPDFFDNPDAATQNLIARTLEPYIQGNEARMMYYGRMIAQAVHGGDAVNEAEKAFMEAHDSKTLDPVDYERVVQSPNRYDAAVQWHKTRSILNSVGNDPTAWFNRQLEEKMSDPKFQALMLERVQKGAASRPSETKLPPSLSRSTAVASSAMGPMGDLSDKSLFDYAMTGKRN